MNHQQMLKRIRSGKGFIAALDQSGGSTPKALEHYGIQAGTWSHPDEMFDVIHQMRSRIINSSSFSGDKILGAILFEDTMNRSVDGLPTAQALWERKQVVPFLKIDKGLDVERNGVQLLRSVPGLEDLLTRAKLGGIFGTKSRSVIGSARRAAIDEIVAQQFEMGEKVLAYGLMPILEPEVLINTPEKDRVENQLLSALLAALDNLSPGVEVMLKLSLPTTANLYRPLVNHPKVLRVIALSGGYSRQRANEILSQNDGMIASFSRALIEELRAQQTAAQFDQVLGQAVESIYEASIVGTPKLTSKVK